MQKEMRNKLTRVLYELNELDKGQIRVKDMARETGVSVRTIERDMNDIEDANFSLWNPEPGVWAFIEGVSLEKMQLTSIEASILVLMSDVAGSRNTEPKSSPNKVPETSAENSESANIEIANRIGPSPPQCAARTNQSAPFI